MRSRSALASLLVSSAIGAVGLFVACAPTPPTPEAVNSTAVTGTVGSATLTPTSAFAEFVPAFPPNNAPAVGALRITLASKANACGDKHYAGETLVEIRLFASTGVNTGTFPVANGTIAPTDGQAEALIETLDGSCNPTFSQAATSGTLTIAGAHFSGASLNVKGSVDITFAGGHISGNFNAVFCDDGTADANGGPDAGEIAVCSP